jgi:dipeptidyl aminopeptidase/acylaminoacyl peptidase
LDTQEISSFSALQRRGIASRFLYFPDEDHEILKPANSLQWYENVIGWLDRWIR